jgi:O-antigen biosynthesis protein
VVAHELRGYLPVGGMGTATTNLALALARMGHSVEILLGIHSPDAIDPYWRRVYTRAGIAIRATPEDEARVEPWHFADMRRIELGLRADPPEVVIAADFGAPTYTALRLRQAGLAFADTLFVVFCHGPWRYAMDLAPNLAPKNLRHVLAFGSLEQASVELADVVVSPSAYLIAWMRNEDWHLPERTLVIPYFTRAAATGTEVSAPEWRAGEQLQRLTFFGRVDEKKGLQPFAAGLNALEPDLLNGLELEFLGKPTGTWPPARVEGLLAEETRGAFRSVTFVAGLDQHEALTRLRHSGTLAVIPSLQENSPNTVYECLENRIPFVASKVGGIPELIESGDHDRVLFAPTPRGVEQTLRQILRTRQLPPPARAAFDDALLFERWSEVIQMRPPRVKRSVENSSLDVVVVHHRSRDTLSRCLSALENQSYSNLRIIVAEVGRDGPSIQTARHAGLLAGSAPFVVFLDDADIPAPELCEILLRAQQHSDSDVVSCGLRVVSGDRENTLHFFSGEPGGLGMLSNAYGTVALIRRSVLGDLTASWSVEGDPDWPLLAGLSLSGARVVSIPVPLVTRAGRPGSAQQDPANALVVATHAERALSEPSRSMARLAAGLAANSAQQPPAGRRGFARRAVCRLLPGPRRGFIYHRRR